jgi:hypothetical protein
LKIVFSEFQLVNIVLDFPGGTASGQSESPTAMNMMKFMAVGAEVKTCDD